MSNQRIHCFENGKKKEELNSDVVKDLVWRLKKERKLLNEKIKIEIQKN